MGEYVMIIDKQRDVIIHLRVGGGWIRYSTDGEETWRALGKFQLTLSEGTSSVRPLVPPATVVAESFSELDVRFIPAGFPMLFQFH